MPQEHSPWRGVTGRSIPKLARPSSRKALLLRARGWQPARTAEHDGRSANRAGQPRPVISRNRSSLVAVAIAVRQSYLTHIHPLLRREHLVTAAAPEQIRRHLFIVEVIRNMRTERGSWKVLSWALAYCVGCWANFALAQNPPEGKTLNEKGFVMDISPVGVTAKLGTDTWVVNVPANSTISVTGTAEPDYLHPGLYVKFSGELDKKGTVLAKEIDQLEIYTPSSKTDVAHSIRTTPKAKPSGLRSTARRMSFACASRATSPANWR